MLLCTFQSVIHGSSYIVITEPHLWIHYRLQCFAFLLLLCLCVCGGGGGGGGGTRARAHASVRGATFYNFGVIFRKEWSSLYSTWSWSTVLWHQTRRLIWLNLPTPKWWDFLPAASHIAWNAYIKIHWCFCADTVISLPPPPSFFLSLLAW